MHAAFIDLTKAYDTVPRAALWAVLRKWGVPDTLTTLIASFHEGMRASVRTNIGNADAFTIGTGLRQGCSLAPTLFILYFAAVVHTYEQQAVPDVEIAYNINGHPTSKIHYSEEGGRRLQNTENLRTTWLSTAEHNKARRASSNSSQRRQKAMA